jgi:mono/diheme cytochrome c family protein
VRSYRAALVLVCAASLEAADSEAAFFATRIRPLLAHNCFACHTDSRLGGLRLDSREAVLQGGKSGPAILLSNPDDSLLIQAVSYTHSRLKMPPTGKLKEEEIADLRNWIKSGAVWPETSVPNAAPLYVITPERRAFWAFQPVRKPPLASVKNEDWVRSPIDRFILAKLDENGLKPVGPASKQALIRRATFDLIGLPPSPEEVDAFVNDNQPDAFAKVVDRLLSSPHYGERWGRYWLDLARYADGQLGASKDTPYENAFRYRDWVIQALNEDMPYDVFVKAQIAADRMDAVS